MIGIIDYGVGNIGSVGNALVTLGATYICADNPATLQQASGYILPGDGAAREGMKNLKKNNLDIFIRSLVKQKKPLFGICLGMQVLLSKSEEGNTDCLDIISGKVRRLNTNLKIPQIGWNQVNIQKSKKLFAGILDASYFYFVNSYVCDPIDTSLVTGLTEYSNYFCSALESDTIFATQFHPEKSGEKGLKIIDNFLKIVYENNSSY